MKILQVLSGGGWGGGAVVVLAITRALIARGDRVWVVCLDDEVARRFRQAGAEIVRSPFWIRPLSPLDMIPFLQLIALCAKERFDLVATHTSKGGFLGRVCAWLAGVPHIVHHAHGFSFSQATDPFKRRFYTALERLAARAGDLIISVSEEHRHAALKAGVETPERITTVLNGIDLRPFEAGDRICARQRLGFQDTDLVIGGVGRLAPDKGFEYLIRTMPSVLASFPSARLALIGDGPLELQLRRDVVQAGIATRVHFLGFRPDVPDLLAALDVFVQPSLREGLSISLLEAMAAGKPCVACDIPGNREVIEDQQTGLMVSPADSAALSDAIGRLLGNAGFAQALGNNARCSAQARFSEERMVKDILSYYDRLAAAEPRRTVWTAEAAK
jgi:glycosyltransferase involved in cell wall biosynthesis